MLVRRPDLGLLVLLLPFGQKLFDRNGNHSVSGIAVLAGKIVQKIKQMLIFPVNPPTDLNAFVIWFFRSRHSTHFNFSLFFSKTQILYTVNITHYRLQIN